MAMNDGRSDWEIGVIRVWIATGLMVLFLLGIGARLWTVQVIHAPTYQSLVREQSVRSVRIPAWRGRIFDRNGEVLAGNRASHCVAIYPEELRKPGQSTTARVDAIVRELEDRLGVKSDLRPGQVERHLSSKERLLPIIAWKDLDDVSLARWAERVTPVPGIDLYTQPLRVYPNGDMACHTLGYVRDVVADRAEADEESAGEDYDLYLPEMQGKTGLELALDEHLRGSAGGQLYMIDSMGYRHALLQQRDPLPGRDYQLCIDARIQKLAESALGDEPGAVVVTDVNNGEVLALASFPRFNPNQFMPRMPQALYSALSSDPRKVWINRPVQMTYLPGSTFKMIVAFAAAVNDRVPLDRVYHCPGYFEIGGTRMHCAHRNGHGDLNLRQAIERSCNVYFFNLGLETGYEYIYHMAEAVGLGHRTGIELGPSVERPGILGNNAYKQRVYGDNWRDGDTANLSIGQGMVDATPLQMTLFTAAIANGGILHKPRLVKAVRTNELEPFIETLPEVANNLNWPRDILRVVRDGMRDVIMGDHGTGRGARVAGLDYSAKTGTAQFRSGDHTSFRAWMIAYAPSARPRYAVTVTLDVADAAGLSCAPRMKRLMEGLFALPPAEGAP